MVANIQHAIGILTPLVLPIASSHSKKEHVNMEGEEALSIRVGKAVFLLSPLKYVDQQHKKGKKESMEKMGCG